MNKMYILILYKLYIVYVFIVIHTVILALDIYEAINRQITRGLNNRD